MRFWRPFSLCPTPELHGAATTEMLIYDVVCSRRSCWTDYHESCPRTHAISTHNCVLYCLEHLGPKKTHKLYQFVLRSRSCSNSCSALQVLFGPCLRNIVARFWFWFQAVMSICMLLAFFLLWQCSVTMFSKLTEAS